MYFIPREKTELSATITLLFSVTFFRDIALLLKKKKKKNLIIINVEKSCAAFVKTVIHFPPKNIDN